jgi:hypothetical protein
MESLVKRSCR